MSHRRHRHRPSHRHQDRPQGPGGRTGTRSARASSAVSARLLTLLGTLALTLVPGLLPLGVTQTASAQARTTGAGGAALSAALGAQQPPHEVTPASGQVTLSIDALAPEVVHGDEDLVVTGTITNGTSSPLSGASLVAQVQERTEVTSEALSLWLADERDTPLSGPSATDLPQQVLPGQTVPFSVTVGAEDLPLTDDDQWGPRGIQVALTDTDTTLATDRSVLIWDNASAVEPARVTTLVPVTASTEELTALTLPTGTQVSSGTAASDVTVTGVQQRIQALLALAGDGVVLAVDPALMEALGVSADSFQGELAGTQVKTGSASQADSKGAPAGEEAGGADPLAAALTRATATGEVVALPWDDGDVAALAHLGNDDLLARCVQRSQDSVVAGAGAGTSLAWLASSELDERSLEALPGSVTTVVAPSGSVPVTDNLTYVPSGTTLVEGRTVLLPDEPTSLALAGRLPDSVTSTGDSTASPDATRKAGDHARGTDSQRLSDLDARQLLRGQTAIFTRQAPSVGRDLVVALDRAAGAAMDPAVLAQRLGALHDTSWTAPQRLGRLEDQAREDAEEAEHGYGGVSRMEPEQEVSDDDELSPTTLDQATVTGRRLNSIASVLSDPRAALGRSDDVESVISSASWRSDPAARGTYLDSAEAAGHTVVSSLSAAPSSTINIINSEANMPVRIDSTLDQDVTVQVHLVPDSQRLQVPDTATVTVPAHGQATATVPVRAVGSGDVSLTIEILSADGVASGTPTTVQLRVRAAWESVGTGVTGGVLALILVSGVVRTIRRGRRTAVPLAAQEKA